MPEAVVDELEPVQIDKAHRNGRARASGATQRDVEMLAKQHAIREPGERVVVGEKRELLLGRLASGDVADHAVQERHLAVLVEDALAALQHPPHGSVDMQDAVLELERRLPADRLGDDLFDALAILGVDHARVGAHVVVHELRRGIARDRLDSLRDELHRPVERRRAAVDRARDVLDQCGQPFAVPTTEGRFFLVHATSVGAIGGDRIPLSGHDGAALGWASMPCTAQTAGAAGGVLGHTYAVALSGFENARLLSAKRAISSRAVVQAPQCCCCTAFRRRMSAGGTSLQCWLASTPSWCLICAGMERHGRRAGGQRGEGYSKREMAAELIELMAGLGHERFAVVGHDRGARVAYRLALDHPERVTRVALLNIIPTIDQFERMGKGPRSVTGPGSSSPSRRRFPSA